jgi:hypothetical protein
MKGFEIETVSVTRITGEEMIRRNIARDRTIAKRERRLRN